MVYSPNTVKQVKSIIMDSKTNGDKKTKELRRVQLKRLEIE